MSVCGKPRARKAQPRLFLRKVASCYLEWRLAAALSAPSSLSPQNSGLFFLGNRHIVRSARHYAEPLNDVKQDVPVCRSAEGLLHDHQPKALRTGARPGRPPETCIHIRGGPRDQVRLRVRRDACFAGRQCSAGVNLIETSYPFPLALKVPLISS